MGFFKLLVNAGNEEGIREAIKMSYKRIAKTLMHSVPDELFQSAMYNALGSRYIVNNLQVNEMIIWLELLPFLRMTDQEIALNNLSEYIIYKEMPLKCNYEGLKRELTKVINVLSADEKEMIKKAKIIGVKWAEIIDMEEI